jgi:hypothetical protein
LDTYLDALQFFTNDCEVIEVAKSRAFLVKKDIFRNLMWYTMPDSNKQYPLTIERVKKIKALNKEGIRPDDLEPVEVLSGKPKEVEPEYADVVGQISLKTLEKDSRKRRERERGQQNPNQNRNNQQRPPQNRNQNPQQGQGQPQQNRGGQNQSRPNNPNQNRGPQNPNQNRNPNQNPNQNRNNQNRPPQNRNQGPQQGGNQQNRGQQDHPKTNPDNNQGGDKKE